jgi:hypothetical protein
MFLVNTESEASEYSVDTVFAKKNQFEVRFTGAQ